MEWQLIDRKSVPDMDGFLTDYSLYTNGKQFVTVFGDSDIYGPEDGWWDWETDSRKEALEWFAYYEGFDEEAMDY